MPFVARVELPGCVAQTSDGAARALPSYALLPRMRSPDITLAPATYSITRRRNTRWREQGVVSGWVGRRVGIHAWLFIHASVGPTLSPPPSLPPPPHPKAAPTAAIDCHDIHTIVRSRGVYTARLRPPRARARSADPGIGTPEKPDWNAT